MLTNFMVVKVGEEVGLVMEGGVGRGYVRNDEGAGVKGKQEGEGEG